MSASAHEPGLSGADSASRSRNAARSRVWTEATVGRAALGLVALHVADDNFLQPEPGMSAGDHLLSGLVPLGLLALAAFAYPRLRAGSRAMIALIVGVFGDRGRSRGCLLHAERRPVRRRLHRVAVARRRPRARRPRNRHALEDAAHGRQQAAALPETPAAHDRGLLVATQIMFPLVIAQVVTHTARAHVPAPDLGAAHEDVTFETSDGLRLHGWFVPSRNGATVIVFPGRSGPQQQTRMLVRHGYGVLLFDRRGEGRSDGDPNIFGWGGDRDLHAAAAYLQSREDVDGSRIGAIGLSVGGEMLIRAAAHSDAFRAIVSEGASGQSLRDELDNPGLSDRLLDLPTQVSLTAALAVLTNRLPPPSLRSEVAKIAPTPVFFIYGEHGQGGTETAPNKGFYEAAREPKQIWEVPNGQHVAGITTVPKEYERRVIGFFEDALLERK